jgi:hypothetical protein
MSPDLPGWHVPVGKGLIQRFYLRSRHHVAIQENDASTEASIASIGSVGDSYYNAPAKSTIGQAMAMVPSGGL